MTIFTLIDFLSIVFIQLQIDRIMGMFAKRSVGISSSDFYRYLPNDDVCGLRHGTRTTMPSTNIMYSMADSWRKIKELSHAQTQRIFFHFL